MKLIPIKTSLNWHLLNALTEGSEITELMAATSQDGIGLIVRWKKETDGWETESMDTELGQWDYVDFYDESNEVPEEPPFEFGPDPLSFDPADPEVLWILGRPNFWCGPIAHILQAAGQPIPKKAEDEQAAIIVWAIRKYQEHGSDWKAKADIELNAILKALKEPPAVE